MILVDTSVWIDHLNKADAHLQELLRQDRVRIHPFVLGEIALGKLRKRDELLQSLSGLQMVPIATESDLMVAINALSLDGTGIGYVDAHLLLSARLNGVKLWTRDKRLSAQANRLHLQYLELQ